MCQQTNVEQPSLAGCMVFILLWNMIKFLGRSALVLSYSLRTLQIQSPNFYEEMLILIHLHTSSAAIVWFALLWHRLTMQREINVMIWFIIVISAIWHHDLYYFGIFHLVNAIIENPICKVNKDKLLERTYFSKWKKTGVSFSQYKVSKVG